VTNHQRNETTEDRFLREQKQREYKREYTDPIKHFVRKHGWVPAARDRLQQVREEGREYLKYFTLCAEKAIDVHLFGIVENLVEYDGRRYPRVVFCEYHAETYELIAAALGGTRGFLAEFESLVLDQDRQISKDFYLELPFDIYNLDFTSWCFPKGDPPFSRTLDAIVTLIQALGSPQYQQGFDMFLTFRAQRSEENEDAISQLKGNVRDNRKQYDWFSHAFLERYGGDIGPLLNRRYHDFLLLTLPKLLGRFGCEAGFQVACSHRFYYPRPDAQRPDYHIISFGLSFDWVGEDTGLRRSVRQNVPRQEVIAEAYIQMLRQIIEESITNVGAARFPRDQYKQEVQVLLEMAESP
jgi:hypothetical protein